MKIPQIFIFKSLLVICLYILFLIQGASWWEIPACSGIYITIFAWCEDIQSRKSYMDGLESNVATGINPIEDNVSINSSCLFAIILISFLLVSSISDLYLIIYATAITAEFS